MADAGTLNVKIGADIRNFKNGLRKANSSLSDSVGKFKKNYGAISAAAGASFAAVGIAITKSVQAYGVQEQAIAKLNQSLKNQGNFTKEASRDLQDYASSLQSVTTYGDETILSAQSLIASFGFEGQALKDLTKATLDLATAKGMKLNAAADLVSKSVGSSTNALTRYGIEVTGAAGSTERAQNAVKNINALFGGQAETLRNTTLGQWQAFQNAVGDLQETFGSFIAGPGTTFAIWLTKVVENVIAGINTIRQAKEDFGSFFNVVLATGLEAFRLLAQAIVDFANQFLMVGPVLRLVGVNIDNVKQSIDNQINAWQASAQAAMYSSEKAAEAEQYKNEVVQSTTEAINAATDLKTQHDLNKAEERIQAAVEENQAKNVITGEQAEFQKKMSEDWNQFGRQQVEKSFTQFGSGVADMIMDGRKFSDVMKSMWEDMARAFIAQVAKMIAKWLAFKAMTAAFGGGFGAFMQHGGIINEPSVVTGIRTGRTRFAGEAGPEAVVPLNNDPRNMFSMSDFKGKSEGGGGPINITFNVTGTFLEGSEVKWQRLVQDKLVPTIRRFTTYQPTAPFVRKRGVA